MAISLSVSESGEESPMSDINTTPLVDVMLVMLIIFLITVPVVREAIPLTLPKVAYQVTLTKPENVLLAVKANSKNGQCEVYWGMERVNSQQLLDRAVKRLEKLIKDVGGVQNVTEENMPEVHIRGDRGTPFRCIGGTMYMMQMAGFQRIGFISEPDPSATTTQRL
jgi:biopolymer transport protein ExbD